MKKEKIMRYKIITMIDNKTRILISKPLSWRLTARRRSGTRTTRTTRTTRATRTRTPGAAVHDVQSRDQFKASPEVTVHDLTA